MHFEFLVEDQSGARALEILLPKMLDGVHTFKIHPYRGAGRIPKNLKPKSDAGKRILLDQLPRLLKGYGNAWPEGYHGVVIVMCDLDDRDKTEFQSELLNVLDSCNPKPNARFYFAIEELEAWYLGDQTAIRTAYPFARTNILARYENDSICGTWELLADAIYPGGSESLLKKGPLAVGKEKSAWAMKISPEMKTGNNTSPSFKIFRSGLAELGAAAKFVANGTVFINK